MHPLCIQSLAVLPEGPSCPYMPILSQPPAPAASAASHLRDLPFSGFGGGLTALWLVLPQSEVHPITVC